MGRDTSLPTTDAPPADGRPDARDGAAPRRRRRPSIGGWEVALLIGLAAVALLASLFVDQFAEGSNVSFLLLDVVAIGLIALPMTLVIITGEIDLSVASALGLSSAFMGQLWESGLTIGTIALLCLLLGAALGAANGFFVTYLGLPSLAVTIGTLALYRGLAFVILGDRAVASFPPSWTSLATSNVPGTPIPVPFAALMVFALLFGVLLHATPIGRSLYAIGYNEEGAKFSGVATARTKFWLFVTTGTVSALAGVFWTLRFASARADNAQGLELSIVAAVLLGGVSIFGGKGALPGVLGGVLLLGTLTNALQLAAVSADALTVVTGLLLIVSVVAPNLATRIRTVTRRRTRSPSSASP